jgi:prepilin-type N-terminal cleavage/methylation domain-containing protein/prepilin-type processing-associated H-X9-DG protein
MRRAFTLVELLVVIGIIAVLIAIILPSLTRARSQASAVKCMSNLRQIAMGLVMYSSANKGYVVPSYNVEPLPGSTSNVTGGPNQPFDGWACILDRDGFVKTPERDTNTIFYCPDTVDVEGMKDGQTGVDFGKPRGWTDWPLKFTTVGGESSPKVATTIPGRGFDKIIRVSYWLNAYNPIGNAVADLEPLDQHYTASVGFGPDAKGNYIKLRKTTSIKYSSRLITVADGVYMGRHGVTRLYDANSRIGYRHPGLGMQYGSANIGFADGHVETIDGKSFPRAIATGESPTIRLAKKTENLQGPTIYANPERAIP